MHSATSSGIIQLHVNCNPWIGRHKINYLPKKEERKKEWRKNFAHRDRTRDLLGVRSEIAGQSFPAYRLTRVIAQSPCVAFLEMSHIVFFSIQEGKGYVNKKIEKYY